MKKIFLATLISIFNYHALFAIYVSQNSGKWGDIKTWGTTSIPNENDSVIILNGHRISASENFNSCRHLKISGELTFVSANKKLSAYSVELLDSGSITGIVLGDVIVSKMCIMGNNNISGINLTCSDSTLIKGHINFKRKSGIKNLHHVVIFPSGFWEVKDDDSFYLYDSFSNNGSFSSGAGIYHFMGTINVKGKSKNNFERVKFYKTLINLDSLSIHTSMEAPDSAEFINDVGATLILNTTPGNFKVNQLNLKALNNSLVLNRNQNQALPMALDHEYQNLFLQNEGVCTLIGEVKLGGTLKVSGNCQLEIKNHKILPQINSQLQLLDSASINFFHSQNQNFTLFLQEFKNVYFQNSSKLILYLDADLTFPYFSYFPQLDLVGQNQVRKVNFTHSNPIIKGDLYANSLVELDISKKQLILNGSWTGSSKFIGPNSSVIYQGEKFQRVFAGNYDTLIFSNSSVDTSQAFGTYEIKNLQLQKGLLKIGSLKLGKTVVEDGGILLIGGVKPVFEDSLLIKGQLKILSDGANCNFSNIFIFPSGELINQSLSNHILSGNFHNDGIFNSCAGTGCTWEIKENINFYFTGTKEVWIPRLKTPSLSVVHVKGNLYISNRIFGGGSFISYPRSVLNLGMNPDLMEAKFNTFDYGNHTIIFSNFGNQEIAHPELKIFHHLQIRNVGSKKLLNNITVKGNLTIDSLSTLDCGAKQIYATVVGKVSLDKKSTLILGDSQDDFPTQFPINVLTSNCFFDTSSSVIYTSAKDQQILGSAKYGNLILRDGVGEVNKKTLAQGDSIWIKGKLEIDESSVLFEANNKYLEVDGDWNGPGNMALHGGHLVLKGNANSTGEIQEGVHLVSYEGSKNQNVKVGAYHLLNINKSSGTASVAAGDGYLKVGKKLSVSQGILEIKGEKIHVLDSTFLNGELKFSSRVQEKIFKNIYLSENGKFNNEYGVDIKIEGSVLNDGFWICGGRKLIFSAEGKQLFNNLGRADFAGIEINKTSDSLELRGVLQISDTLNLITGHLLVNDGSLSFIKKASLKGESASNTVSGNKFKFFTELNLSSGINDNIKGLGVSLQSETPFGSTIIERHFSPYDIYYGYPGIRKSFYIKPSIDSSFIASLSINYYPHELNGMEKNSLAMYKSKNKGLSFAMQTTYNDTSAMVLSVHNITSFSLWTAGDNNIQVLPLELLYFTGIRKEENIKLTWETAAEWDIKEYQIWISLDGINFEKLEVIQPLLGFKPSNFYQISHSNYNSDVTYYRLIEISVDGEANQLDDIAIEPYLGITSNIYLNEGNLRWNSENKIQQIEIFDLHGKLVFTQEPINNSLLLPTSMKGTFLVKGFDGRKIYYCKVFIP